MITNYNELSSEYDLITEELFITLNNYAYKKIPTGGFLEAVLCNDLSNAFGRADSDNILAMHQIVKFVYNKLPCGCWGSKEIVDAWLNGE